MTETLSKIRRRVMTSALVLPIAIPSAVAAAPDDLVYIWGKSTDRSLAFSQMPAEPREINVEEACEIANFFMHFGGLPNPSSVQHHLFGEELVEAELPVLDCSEARPPTDEYVMTFSTCSMTITDGIHTMYWTVPPGTPEAQMAIVNAQTREFIAGALLETQLSEVKDFAKGREISQTVRPTSETRDFEIKLEIGPTGNYRVTTETFTGQAYKFDYEGEIGLPGMQDMGLPMSKLESDGTAWISSDVPGSDVVAKFYENFKNHVTPATEAGTLMTAMIEQMADVVQNGIPLETKQTVKTSMPFGGFGNVAQGDLTQGSTSTSEVVGVTVWQGAASEHEVCGHMQAPEGYTTVNMSDMSTGSPQMSSNERREMQEAMQQLTPEQRQAMEQFNVGDMMQQMMGGADPAAQPAAGGAAAGAAAAGAAGANAGGSTMPPAEELNAGNLTESVERHLQALGYDVGDIDGEASMETTIAISTFQAEKGMEVTGEVSPQLLGVLSAEVDSRR